MNIEVKRSIEIDDVLTKLRKLSKEQTGTEFVGVEKELIEDTVQVIDFLVKKNKQLRDINKTLTDKITRKNNTISELGKQAKELNDQVFELESKVKEGKCCCKNEEEEEPTLQEVLNELEVLHELIVISRSIGIL